jgi:hypothetical protein
MKQAKYTFGQGCAVYLIFENTQYTGANKYTQKNTSSAKKKYKLSKNKIVFGNLNY